MKTMKDQDLQTYNQLATTQETITSIISKLIQKHIDDKNLMTKEQMECHRD
jgi:hypothetical protein